MPRMIWKISPVLSQVVVYRSSVWWGRAIRSGCILDEHGPVRLECPFFGWQGELFMQDVANLVDERVAEESTVYLLVEPELRFTDLSMLRVRTEFVHRYPRPFDGMAVELWRIYPNTTNHNGL